MQSTARLKEAVEEELQALEKNQTWKIVQLPLNKKFIGCRWVRTIKYHSVGSIELNKAQLESQCHTQINGIDYSETFVLL